MKNNQKGFSTVESLLILVIAAILGFTGWFVYNSNKKTKATYDSASKIANSANPKYSKLKSSTKPQMQANSYGGWQSYCDSSTGSCFKYPSDWLGASPLAAQNTKAFSQNKTATINLEYSEPVSGKGGLNNFLTVSVNPLTRYGSPFEVVGGYFTAGNVPGYYVIDKSLAQQLGLTTGKTTDISNNDLYFTKNSQKATLVAHLNNTSGQPTLPASQANTWFSSADGKTALLVAQSLYTK